MNKKQVIIMVVTVVIILLVAAAYVRSNEKDMRALFLEEITTQETKLETAAALVYTNGNDEVVSTYVRDCTTAARAEFDSNLDRLAELSAVELERTELLFGACASFFADKKMAGVERLRETYSQYEQLVRLFAIIEGRAHRRFQTEDWELFIAFQEQLAELLREQIPIQKDIITLLQNGVRPGDAAIQTKIEAAQEISQSATVITRQADSVYSRLTK